MAIDDDDSREVALEWRRTRWLRAWLTIQHFGRRLFGGRTDKSLIGSRVHLRLYLQADDTDEAKELVGSASRTLGHLGRAAPLRVRPTTSGAEELFGRSDDPRWLDCTCTTRPGWENDLIAGVDLLARRMTGSGTRPMRAARIASLLPEANHITMGGELVIVGPLPPHSPLDGTGATVAVIDTVLDCSRLTPELANRVETPATATESGWELGPTVVADPPAHAAVIVTLIAGIAPGARIVHIALDEMTTDHLPGALLAARRLGSDVVNLSMTIGGGSKDKAHRRIHELVDENLAFLQQPENFVIVDAVLDGWGGNPVVVAATGNIPHDGADRAPMGYPASSELTMAIGGVTNDRQLGQGSRFGGKRGQEPAAWWVVPSGDRVGNNIIEPFATINGLPTAGTSFAAAIASGLLARARTTSSAGVQPTPQLPAPNAALLPDFDPQTHGRGLFTQPQ